jgi:NitT/TauT family transport system permease protein
MKRSLWIVSYTIALLVVWEGAVRVLHIPSYILPSPGEIASEFVANPILLLESAWVTFYETIAGFALGTLVGIALALLIASSQIAEALVMPTVLALQSVPKVAVAPLFLVWFGLGLASKLVLISTTAFFPVLLSTLSGLTSVEAEMIDLIRGMNGTKFQVFRKVRVPFSIPYIFNGMKIAVPLAMIGAVVAEFISSERGLGNLILISGQNMRTSLNFASLVAITLLSSLIFELVVVGERIVLRFMPTMPRA